MELLKKIRQNAGPRQTRGLDDTWIAQFLAKDITLGLAINMAFAKWKTLDAATTYRLAEATVADQCCEGFCHLYPPETRNPYVTLAAKGPWLITLHGAVLHDSGGYGMLGLGHSPDAVLKAMAEPEPMANIMTPSLAQRSLIQSLKGEIGRNRLQGCPYTGFIMMQSGSEANTVADRYIDIHTGHAAKGRAVVGITLGDCFHGRTFKAAVWTDSTQPAYNKHQADSILKMRQSWAMEPVPLNDIEALQARYEEAEQKNLFVELIVMESVQGEGSPGASVSPEFYKAARELSLKHDSMLLIDNVQSGFRTTGCLSIVDFPGFENLPEPDFETFSKAINAGQFPISLVAMSARAVAFYRHGTYGNTMTGNPRACNVATAVLDEMTSEVRENIVAMGNYAVERYEALRKQHPDLITHVTGRGLLYAVHLNPEVFTVVALDGAETWLRENGIGVIHGGSNALRFTPHFKITKDEIELQVAMVKEYISRNSMKVVKQIADWERRFFDEKDLGAGDDVVVTLTGHLFDSMVINDALNLVEAQGASARMLRLHLGSTVQERSEATFQVLSKGVSTQELLARLREMSTGKGCEIQMSFPGGVMVQGPQLSRL